MYYLMNKDERLASFMLKDNRVYELYPETEDLPYGFVEDPTKYLNSRKATAHNNHLKALMQRLGCERLDGFLRITHALGLNDTIWVMSDNERLRWRNVSLYRNPFNQVIEQLAFEGYGLPENLTGSASPSLTTDGMFPKCFRREGDGIFLYKRGSEGADNSGKESYSEALASEIVNIIAPNSVSYDLTYLHDRPASRCSLFTSEDMGYVPVRDLLNTEEKSFQDIFDYFKELGSEQAFREMMVADAIILNEDRHYGNFGVLLDNNSFEPVTMAPLFDENISLATYIKDDEFGDNIRINELRSKQGDDFVANAAKFMTPDIRDRVEVLHDFHFTFRGDDFFTEERVDTLENIVHTMADAVCLNKTTMLSAFPSEVLAREQDTVAELHSKKEALLPVAEKICDSLSEYEVNGFYASMIEDSTMLAIEVESETGDFVRRYDFMSGVISDSDMMGHAIKAVPDRYKDILWKMDVSVSKVDVQDIFGLKEKVDVVRNKRVAELEDRNMPILENERRMLQIDSEDLKPKM